MRLHLSAFRSYGIIKATSDEFNSEVEQFPKARLGSLESRKHLRFVIDVHLCFNSTLKYWDRAHVYLNRVRR